MEGNVASKVWPAGEMDRYRSTGVPVRYCTCFLCRIRVIWPKQAEMQDVRYIRVGNWNRTSYSDSVRNGIRWIITRPRRLIRIHGFRFGSVSIGV